MAEILVLVDHADGAVKKVTLELLTKARELAAGSGHTPAAVLFGPAFDTAKDKLAEYGAAKVYVAADPELDGYVVAPKAELLAKLVATGATREEARARMEAALEAFVIEGVKTAIPLHLRVMRSAAFREGRVHTQLVEQGAFNA